MKEKGIEQSHLSFSFVSSRSLTSFYNAHLFLSFCVCVFLRLCLSLFPVLCFKAEACVTHSTWHMKPLSCLEPGVREKEGGKKGGERDVDVGGVRWNEGDLSLSPSLPLCLTSYLSLTLENLKEKKSN